MSNWDLLMPGMGLTGIGLAGQILAYAGIAHTFIDGMHALTGLTMFVGLIFTAAGILDGGISTSKRAKITTLIIIGISLGFGIYALGTMNTSDFTFTVVLILLAVALPALAIGYIAMKKPGSIKPIGLVLGLAVASAMVIWITAGAINQEGEITEKIINEEIIDEKTIKGIETGPIFTIEILKDSAQEGNPDYNPDKSIVTQGYIVEWINADIVAHTVTSAIDYGETFDSSLISPEETFTLDTTNLEIGEYEYLCIVHPWMTATVVIEATKSVEETVVESVEETVVESVTQTIIKTTDNSGMGMDCQASSDCYTPSLVTVNVGSVVTMINSDSTASMHSFTAGTVDGFTPSPSGTFDTGILNADASFEWTPETAGEVPYYCMLHTWMQGTIIVE